MKNKLHPLEKFMANEAFIPFDPTARAVTVDARALRAAVRRIVRELAEIGGNAYVVSVMTVVDDGTLSGLEAGETLVRDAILGTLAKKGRRDAR